MNTVTTVLVCIASAVLILVIAGCSMDVTKIGYVCVNYTADSDNNTYRKCWTDYNVATTSDVRCEGSCQYEKSPEYKTYE